MQFIMDEIAVLALLAGLLHLTGYVCYIRNDDIEPNPITWLMFAYGTLLLTVLEWDSDATPSELVLPTVCSGMAMLVAARCWQRARRADPTRFWPKAWWPSDWRDRLAFQIDLLLTALYVGAALLLYADWIDDRHKEFAVLVFLLAANFTTLTAFFPLIRNVVDNPGDERATPWAIWTCAYSLLGLTTYLSQGVIWTELMVYPALNAVLHGTVAVLSRESRRSGVPARSAAQISEPG